MAKYGNLKEMDKRIEQLIEKKVVAYQSDWTDYDKPKYERLKESKDKNDRIFVLIVRKYGTWLVTLNEIKTSKSMRGVYEYYFDQENAQYFLVDIDKVEMKRHTPSMAWLREMEVA